MFLGKLIHRKDKGILNKEMLSENINLDRLFSSLGNRSDIAVLYKELSIKAHPDNFCGDSEKIKSAELIFKEIQKSKTDLNRLKELEEIVLKTLYSKEL